MDLWEDEWRGIWLKVPQNFCLGYVWQFVRLNIIFALYQFASMASYSEQVFT
jgi:hypothetical protein